MSLHWLHPSGGLRYHLRAARYRNTLWREYIQRVQQWLSSWSPGEGSLLLVGPSGGYSLEPTFLTRFRRIEALDPDPLAERIFRARFHKTLGQAHTRLHWNRSDVFSPSPDGFQIARFAEFLQRDVPRETAVLFSNFLGQMYLLDPKDSYGESLQQWLHALPSVLSGRSWGSYHDRFSGNVKPSIPPGFTAVDTVSNEQLAEIFYAGIEVDPEVEVVELEDHRTEALFPGRMKTYIPWEIEPGVFHVIEAVCHVEPLT
jgi:hypothetical protein